MFKINNKGQIIPIKPMTQVFLKDLRESTERRLHCQSLFASRFLPAFSNMFSTESNFQQFFNWDSLHARLNRHYEAQSYKEKKYKKMKTYRKSIWKELKDKW